jgi:hypothetical protein
MGIGGAIQEVETVSKKKLNDYFKCIYFLLSKAPLGQSH